MEKTFLNLLFFFFSHKISNFTLQVANVLFTLLDNHLQALASADDLAEYRNIKANDHIIFKNLPNAAKKLGLYPTWECFANVFHFDPAHPLKKTNGSRYSPFVYAVKSKNLPVTKYLLDLKANVNEQITYSRGAYEGYAQSHGYAPMHMIMKSGYTDEDKEIFDLLLAGKANPYQYARGFREKSYRDPLSAAVVVGNT